MNVNYLRGRLTARALHVAYENLHLVIILKRSWISISHTMTENRQLTAQIKRQGNQETVRCGRADRQEYTGRRKIARTSASPIPRRLDLREQAARTEECSCRNLSGNP